MKIGKSIFKIILLVAFIYLVTAFGFYFFQEKFIFQVEKLPADYAFQFSDTFEEHFISMHDGVQVHALLFKTKQPVKGLILYFHGNADNLQRWGKYASDLTRLGYDVLMTDYRGYGKSGGEPSEENLYRDAQTIVEWSQQNFQYNRLIIYGRSLGAAVGSNLATHTESDYLILETPFDEIRSVAHPAFQPVTRFLSRRLILSNKEHLKQVKCGVLILHGTDDWVVPLESELKLKPFLKPSDEFIIIEGGGHKNLNEFEEYHRAIGKVLQ